ncbi:hypothetical protein BASA81_006447 [Batrachochytrium salamandrivorans]|nr:hypothetical protein BASA81_006447 [Batrachochytrium salamandrivorans]
MLLLLLVLVAAVVWGKSLSGQGRSYCSLQLDGQVFCFGLNNFGQLGIDSKTDSPIPAQMLGVDLAINISAGKSMSCIVEKAGIAKCTGRSLLGTGTRDSSTVLVPLPSLDQNVTQVYVSYYHACVLQGLTGSLSCWGTNAFGALGDGSTTTRDVPVFAHGFKSGGAKDVAMGIHHTCLLSVVGKIHCTGMNTQGQLGDGTVEHRRIMTPVAGLDSIATFSSVGCGAEHTCAVSMGGRVFCWGSNRMGQLGQPSTLTQATTGQFLAASGAEYAHSVTCGAYSNYLILRANSTVVVFGTNPNNGFGGNNNFTAFAPIRFGNDQTQGVKEVQGGYTSTCVTYITNPHTECVGIDTYGQLGNGKSLGSSRELDSVADLPILSTKSPVVTESLVPTVSPSASAHPGIPACSIIAMCLCFFVTTI